MNKKSIKYFIGVLALVLVPMASRLLKVKLNQSNYLILGMWTLLLLVSVYSSSLCYGTTKKDIWKRSLITLVGIGKISFHLESGYIGYNLLSIGLPAMGIAFKTNTVEVLHFSFPIGLLFYWLVWYREDREEIQYE
jgi:hypothetical protein